MMDRIEAYRAAVKRVLQELADFIPDETGIRKEMICDDERGHYQLMQIGWDNKRRIHTTLLHVDIHDGKVHVERDGTDLELVQDLLDAGIPASDMVLEFHPPMRRKYTEFAVA